MGRPCAASIVTHRGAVVAGKPCAPDPPASESGRPIISISRFAAMFAMGATGCRRYQRVPNRPTSSPVVAAKMTVRFGFGPRAYCSRDLDDGGGARRIIVGAVVDGIALPAATNAEVIVVRVDEDDGVLEYGIAPADDPDNVDRRGPASSTMFDQCCADRSCRASLRRAASDVPSSTSAACMVSDIVGRSRCRGGGRRRLGSFRRGPCGALRPTRRRGQLSPSIVASAGGLGQRAGILKSSSSPTAAATSARRASGRFRLRVFTAGGRSRRSRAAGGPPPPPEVLARRMAGEPAGVGGRSR